MKVALITGITGQDGAYLAEFLLKKGYMVHGIKRRSSLFNTDRVDHIYEDPHIEGAHFKMHYGDLTDSTNLIRIIQEVQPDEIYNLGAMSHVHVSFDTPEYTANCDAVGTLQPGAYLEGRIDTGVVQALVVPAAAVVLRDGFPTVFTVDAKGIAHQVRIDAGTRDGGQVEVRSGLKPGGRVVVAGAGFLAEGDPVRVVDAAAQPAGTP